MQEVPITSWNHALKGFISGSLVALGVVSPIHIAFQAALAALGIIIFADSCLRFGELHILTVVAGFISGALISTLSHLAGYSVYYLFLIVAAAAVLYILMPRKRAWLIDWL
ncbi:MAG: hypothetical protein HY367_02830 [Candidatus Aenigmarchaeota archaeon]|nr:hypothetical protein [Candidatus Aenigmarchaeota archaeon]